MKEQFQKSGFLIEKALFSKRECKDILEGIRAEDYLTTPYWSKSCAVAIPSWAAIAKNDRFVDRVEALIGENVILWGAKLIERIPGQDHQWHNDLESAGSDGFVSIWMGVENTEPITSLKVLPGSHLAPQLLVQYAIDQGIAAEDITDAHLVEWANNFQTDSEVEYLKTYNGDALIFDGRLWHGSNNTTHLKKRSALLIQYARADCAVRIPQFRHFRWPVETFQNPKPPCLILRGSSDPNINLIMPGPPIHPRNSKEVIKTIVDRMEIRPGEPGPKGFKSFSVGFGTTPEFRFMEIHYSILDPGKTPHPPHIHPEEEILMVIEGDATLLIEDVKGSDNVLPNQATAGDFVYYPANWRHTIENTSDKPVLYLMFKWLTDEYHSDHLLPHKFIRGSKHLDAKTHIEKERETEVILEGKTDYLRKLHVHTTHINPDGGYEPHADSYDVAIVLMEGEIQTLNETLTAPAVVYCSAGELHGMKCTGDTLAKYLVFEFHGKHGDIYEHPKLRRKRKLKQSLTNPGIILNHLKWWIRYKLGKR